MTQFAKNLDATVAKVDDSLGLVFGFAIVCTEGGEDYFDAHGDHIPEDSMLKALSGFMQDSRAAKDMHDGENIGQIVFAYPLTADIAKALGITTEKTGALIAMKAPDAILEKFRSGEYTGFSIGGWRIEDEDVSESPNEGVSVEEDNV